MLNWIKEFELTSWMGIALYWAPAALCAYGYTIRTWLNYQRDVAERDKSQAKREQGGVGFYNPRDTIGTLLGRALVTICPIANLWAASFDLAPKMFASFFKRVEQLFDTPLVPPLD